MMYPLDHELVPLHRKATAEERRALVGAPALLPSLRVDDVVAQYLGLRAGDVVRIVYTMYFCIIVQANIL